jgi:hypothetical protein
VFERADTGGRVFKRRRTSETLSIGQHEHTRCGFAAARAASWREGHRR